MYDQPMLRDNALKDKVIIVTGGGTGLGKSMVSYFLDLGASVCITSRKMEVLEKTAAEFEKKAAGRILPVACDVRKYDEVENALNATIEKFGKVNLQAVVQNIVGDEFWPNGGDD